MFYAPVAVLAMSLPHLHMGYSAAGNIYGGYCSKKAGSFEESENNEEAAPQKLEFALAHDTLQAIEKATYFQARYSDDTQRLLYTFSDYGKNFIQSCNMSPDGYVQMALQLAAFRVIGAPVMVFGAASTRRFLHGRPDAFHATKEESVSFCKVFDSPLTSRAEKEQSFRKAVERYKQDAVLAASGLGKTRIIYGLVGIALENKIPLHPFFKDRVFWNPDVVTSQVNLQCDGATFADPRIPDIYMAIYSIRPECFTFGLSVSKSWPEKDAVKFKNAIEKALNELKDCVTRSC